MDSIDPFYKRRQFPLSDTHLIWPVEFDIKDRSWSEREFRLGAMEHRFKREDFLYLEREIDASTLEERFTEHIAAHGVFADFVMRFEGIDWLFEQLQAQGFDFEQYGHIHGGSTQWKEEYGELEWNRSTTGGIHYLLVRNMIYRFAGLEDKQDVLRSWHREKALPRKCGVCGAKFRPSSVSPVFYYWSNCDERWCGRCKIVAAPTREDLNTLLPRFIDVIGFVPHSDCSPTSPRFMRRLTRDNQHQALKLYGAIGTPVHVKKVFGSWFEGLAHTGCLPDGVWVTRRGIKCLARDGHICRSLDEQWIDNWLFDHEIAHDCEPHYPYHTELNENGMRADWRVGDTFIEYFGMMGDESYSAKAQIKALLAKEMGIDLIAIYPEDLNRLETVLGRFATGQEAS